MERWFIQRECCGCFLHSAIEKMNDLGFFSAGFDIEEKNVCSVFARFSLMIRNSGIWDNFCWLKWRFENFFGSKLETNSKKWKKLRGVSEKKFQLLIKALVSRLKVKLLGLIKNPVSWCDEKRLALRLLNALDFNFQDVSENSAAVFNDLFHVKIW